MKKFLIVILIVVFLLVGVFLIYRNSTKENKEELTNIIENDIDNSADVNMTDIEEIASDFEFEYDSPNNLSVNADVINEFNNSLLDTQITSSIIVKDEKIINEYYKEGYDKESIFPIHSCSKSITSSLIGIAIDEGLIENIDVPISTYFPNIENKNITIRHLLTNTSGIQTVEDDWYRWRASENWVDYIINSPMVSTPGKTFSYSTGNTHLLSAIMQKATGKSLYDFGKEKVFDEIRMESIKCETDNQGISDGGNGYTLTAQDMARFGQLYLNKGKWGKKQIVPEEWISQSTSIQFKRNSGTADYGYQWWVRKFGNNNYDAYFAQGHGGQFIFVIPEINLIITFTSNYSDNSQSDMYWQYVENIVNACLG